MFRAIVNMKRNAHCFSGSITRDCFDVKLPNGQKASGETDRKQVVKQRAISLGVAIKRKTHTHYAQTHSHGISIVFYVILRISIVFVR